MRRGVSVVAGLAMERRRDDGSVTLGTGSDVRFWWTIVNAMQTRRRVTILTMREVKHSALVGKPPSLLFTLINDIESYPQFLPWCTHSKVLARSEREIIATIGVKRGPLQGEFTTRNELE